MPGENKIASRIFGKHLVIEDEDEELININSDQEEDSPINEDENVNKDIVVTQEKEGDDKMTEQNLQGDINEENNTNPVHDGGLDDIFLEFADDNAETTLEETNHLVTSQSKDEEIKFDNTVADEEIKFDNTVADEEIKFDNTVADEEIKFDNTVQDEEIKFDDTMTDEEINFDDIGSGVEDISFTDVEEPSQSVQIHQEEVMEEDIEFELDEVQPKLNLAEVESTEEENNVANGKIEVINNAKVNDEILDATIEMDENLDDIDIDIDDNTIEEIVDEDVAKKDDVKIPFTEDEEILNELITDYDELQDASSVVREFIKNNINLITRERLCVILEDKEITLTDYKAFFEGRIEEKRREKVLNKIREIEMQYLFENYIKCFEMDGFIRKKLAIDNYRVKNIIKLTNDVQVEYFTSTNSVSKGNLPKGEISFILCNKLELNFDDYFQDVRAAKMNCENVCFIVLNGAIIEEQAFANAEKYGIKIIRIDIPISIINKTLEDFKKKIK